jgi:prevent-host-death family protein
LNKTNNMTIFMVMKANVHEIKAHLSAYLKRVEAGDTVTVCRRNVPIAELRPLAPLRLSAPRPLGMGRAQYGDFSLGQEFLSPCLMTYLPALRGEASTGYLHLSLGRA